MFKTKKWHKSRNQEHAIISPDGRNKCFFMLKNGTIFYRIERNNEPLIKPSRLGFEICGQPPLSRNFKLMHTAHHHHTEAITMLWGEDELLNNTYNETIFYLAEITQPRRVITLAFRVFDDAVAFRYELYAQDQLKRITIADELTEFNVNPNSIAWSIPAYEPDRYEYNYKKSQISEFRCAVHTPLTIKTPNNYYLAIHEAALYDYGSMTVSPKAGTYKLKADITPLSDGTRAHVGLPFKTPWRLIMVADSAIDLTKNRTMYCLNAPPEKDFSWVKTLKFIGIWWAMYVGEWSWAPGERHGATTAHAKEYIGAAAELGIKGLLIEGWNDGWEGDWLKSGASSSFTSATPDFDLPSVARYAEAHKIELVGHHETVGFIDNYERQLAEAYNYYAINHINYIKTGYAGSMMQIHGRREYHHSQLGVNHYQKTIELAAKKRICLDIHEPIKGTGIERTWPNLLSREGARGQEYEGGSLSPSHTCILPYTRLLAGGMDYTNGIFDITNPAKRINTTIVRQLAYFVTIYSGMTMAADRPFMYQREFSRLFRFIHDVPTDFKKTLPLAGEIGEYYIVARQDKNTDDWYIGGVTNETARHITINLDFLSDDNYIAELYLDSDDAHYLDKPLGYQIKTRELGKTDSLQLYLAPGGGCAIRLHK